MIPAESGGNAGRTLFVLALPSQRPEAHRSEAALPSGRGSDRFPSRDPRRSVACGGLGRPRAGRDPRGRRFTAPDPSKHRPALLSFSLLLFSSGLSLVSRSASAPRSGSPTSTPLYIHSTSTRRRPAMSPARGLTHSNSDPTGQADGASNRLVPTPTARRPGTFSHPTRNCEAESRTRPELNSR